MHNTDSSEELKNAIGSAEARQSVNRQSLKTQLLLTCDSLRPANLIRSTIKEVTSSPILIFGLAVTALGLTTGFLSNRMVIGTSARLMRKLMGNFLALGATNIISKNSEGIISRGKSIFSHLLRKSKTII
jgi:hypothetical protein